MRRAGSGVILGVVMLCSAQPAAAQAQADERVLQVGAQIVAEVSSQFDQFDAGFSGRLVWLPVPVLGIEGELTYYPVDYADRIEFSASRFEGLFGATIGPRLGRFRPFARVRPGFLRFNTASPPFACPTIFPPLLSCSLDGRTLFALDLGGGIEWFRPGRPFVRVDVGDRIVRYPSPVIDKEGVVRDSPFISHDARFGIGFGVRF